MAIPAPASTAEAVDMVLTGLRHLAAAALAALASFLRTRLLGARLAGPSLPAPTARRSCTATALPPPAPGEPTVCGFQAAQGEVTRRWLAQLL